MKINKILMVAAVSALLVSCGGKSGGRPSFGDNEFPVQAVQTKNATIKGVQDVEIRPKVAGFITRVCVKEGQAVSAG